MEILAYLSALFAQLAPLLDVATPILKLLAPIMTALSPVLDVVSGPLSFVFVYLLLPVYVLWLFYLAAMSLKRSRDDGTLTGIAYGFAWPLLGIGYVIDFWVNLTFCSLLFWDLPKEGTMTYRLKRYAKQHDSWRFPLTVWFAKNFLDKFDPAGFHVAEFYFDAQEALNLDSSAKAWERVEKLHATALV